MRTIEISNYLLTLEKLIEFTHEENVILKTSEGRMFVFAEIDDFDIEIRLTRENKELMKFLDERSKETKTYTLAQVRQQLGIN